MGAAVENDKENNNKVNNDYYRGIMVEISSTVSRHRYKTILHIHTVLPGFCDLK